MTNQPANTIFSATTGAATAGVWDPPVVAKMQQQTQGADIRQRLLKDIGAKWSKFTELELRRLKNNADLVIQVVAKYGLDRDQAQRDVDALRTGRNI